MTSRKYQDRGKSSILWSRVGAPHIGGKPPEVQTQPCHRQESSGTASAGLCSAVTDKLFPFFFQLCGEMTRPRPVCISRVEL